jgi:plastocyanin
MARSKWPLRFGAALLGGALAGAAIAAAATGSPDTAVSIENFNFKPGAIAVPVGARLVFENHDDVPHSIVIPGLKLNSGILDTDGRYAVGFDKPGTYAYFCGLHPMMKGVITVAPR